MARTNKRLSYDRDLQRDLKAERRAKQLKKQKDRERLLHEENVAILHRAVAYVEREYS